MSAPMLSPDGTELAYSSGACTSYLRQALVIRQLSTGQETRIVVAGGGVHSASWGPHGQIAMVVAFASSGRHQLPVGYVVAGTRSRVIPRATVRAVTGGCTVAQVAYDATGLLAVQGCPDTTGPAQLVQLAAGGTRLSTVALTASANGSTVSESRDGQHALVTTWSSERTTNYVSVLDGRRVAGVHSYRNPTAFVTHAAW